MKSKNILSVLILSVFMVGIVTYSFHQGRQSALEEQGPIYSRIARMTFQYRCLNDAQIMFNHAPPIGLMAFQDCSTSADHLSQYIEDKALLISQGDGIIVMDEILFDIIGRRYQKQPDSKPKTQEETISPLVIINPDAEFI